MTTALVEPNTEDIKGATEVVVRNAAEIVVDSNDTLQLAGNFLRVIKTSLGQVNEAFDGVIKDAHTTHKNLLTKKKEFTTPLLAAESTVKNKMATYSHEQQRIAREKQQAAEAAQRKIDEDRRQAEALRLEEEGRQKEAEQLIEAPPAPTPIAPIPKAPKVEGVSMRTTYGWELVDATKIPFAYLKLDEVKINAAVRAHHEAAQQMIPGIKVTTSTGVSATGLR